MALSGPIKRLNDSDINKIIITDTIAIDKEKNRQDKIVSLQKYLEKLSIGYTTGNPLVLYLNLKRKKMASSYYKLCYKQTRNSFKSRKGIT